MGRREVARRNHRGGGVTRYQVNPTLVDAWPIKSMEDLALCEGEIEGRDKAQVGDYVVTLRASGFVFIYPKALFEGRFELIDGGDLP